jgi:SPP1 gp7 family putative phage head morphogenesis protein
MRAPLAAFATSKRRRPVRRQLQPDSIRLFYFSRLRALMAEAHALVTEDLLPLVHELRPEHSDATAAARVRAAVHGIAARFARNITPGKLAPLAAQVAQRTSDFQKAQLTAQFKDVLTVAPFIHDVGLATAAEAFTTENIALIRTVPERYFAELADTVGSMIETGARAATIAAEIERRYEVSETNAARIANDQVGKFFGDLNDTRQRALGLTQAVWATARDNRVRDAHRNLNGQVYKLGEGLVNPDTGERILPGQDVNCRCQGLPDVDQLLDG